MNINVDKEQQISERTFLLMVPLFAVAGLLWAVVYYYFGAKHSAIIPGCYSVFAFLINTGVPPTLLKALTGEFTPPGMDSCALLNNDSLLEVFIMFNPQFSMFNFQPREKDH